MHYYIVNYIVHYIAEDINLQVYYYAYVTFYQKKHLNHLLHTKLSL